jgi:hypothetical protein
MDVKEDCAWNGQSAAPIHKLLIAYVFRECGERTTFVRGSLDIGREQEKYLVGDKNLSYASTRHIARTGAVRNYPEALPEAARASVDANTKQVSGYTVVPHFEDAAPKLQSAFVDLPDEHMIGKPEYWTSRRRLIEKAWREIDPDALAFIEDDVVWLSTRSTIPVPDTLFGLPVKSGIPARLIVIPGKVAVA